MSNKKSASRRRAAATKPAAAAKKPRGNKDRTLFSANWAKQPRVRVLAALIGGLVVGVVASSGLRTVVAGEPEAPSWKYGQLSVATSGATWSLPHREYSAAGLDDLYRQLTGTQAPAHVTPAEIINLIGTRGWELVGVSRGDKRKADHYWFRRAS